MEDSLHDRTTAAFQTIRAEPSLAKVAPDLLDLMRFSSRYYHYPIGQVVMGALPQLLRRTRAPHCTHGSPVRA